MNGTIAIIYSYLRRFVRARGFFISVMLEPIFIILIFLALSSMLTASLLSNLIVAFILMMTYFNSIGMGMTLVVEKEFGTIKELLSAPLSSVEIILGIILSSSFIILFPSLILVIIATAFGVLSTSIFSLIALFLLCLMVSCFSLSLGLYFDKIESFRAVIALISFPILIISSVIVPLVLMPPFLKLPAMLNPLTYAADFFRYSFSISYEFAPLISFSILAVVSALMFAICAFMFKKRLTK